MSETEQPETLDSFLTIEGISCVTCQVCGRRLKRITRTHLKKHDLTIEKYQNLYSNAQMTCDETRQKMSKAKLGENHPLYGKTGENHPRFGKHHTKESKKKTSESRKEGIKSGRIIPLSGENHPMYGTHLSDETKQKIRGTVKEGYRSGRIKLSKHVGGFNTGFRTDLNHWFRSNWEANYARILNYQGIKWVFEPKRFDLGECTYLPDFYLPDYNQWIELKGYMRDQDEPKIHLFREMGYNLMVIDTPVYKQLEKEYKHLISEWETPEKTNIVHRIRVRGGAIKGNFTYRNVKKLFNKKHKKI